MEANLISTSLRGCYQIRHNAPKDSRGFFVKIFNADFFERNNLNYQWEEQFISHSIQNTIRGMHFQRPPFDQKKLIYCVDGEILDVILDLRKSSKTYGKYFCTYLRSHENNSIYIEEGLAHGFCTLSKSATVMYLVSKIYSQDHDMGVLWNSFGLNWPTKNPIISARDFGFPPLDAYSSSFNDF
jgi:dTDP-4-dehydrorhamnose 3,5-epimerase